MVAKMVRVKKKRKVPKPGAQQPHKDHERAVRIVKPQKNRRRKKLKGVDESYLSEWEGTKKGKRRPRPAAAMPIPALKTVSDQYDYEQKESTAERELANLKKMVKKMPKSKLKGRGNPFFPEPKEDTIGMTQKIKKAPRFEQGKKETDAAFIKRVELASQRVICSAQFEDYYKVKVEDPNSGKLAVKESSNKTKKNTKRLQEKKIKKKEKMNERLENKKSGFEKFTDEVKFGEVAMAPPEIKAVPRKAEKTRKKPGERSLLLQQVFSGRREVGQTQRRKYLSPGQQRIMDSERNKAIDLYRQLKARRMAQHVESSDS